MKVLFHVAWLVMLALLSTSGAAHALHIAGLFDFFVPYVLFLGLFMPHTQGLVAAALAGLVMDALSAGPFGIYLACYLVFLQAVRLAPGRVEVENPLFIAIACVVGVLFQKLLFFAVAQASADVALSAGLGVMSAFKSAVFASFIGVLQVAAMRFTFKKA